MAYYVLESVRGELYAMRLTLTEDEARRYGREGEMVVVRAVCVWTDRAALENFRQFLSMTQDDRDSPSASWSTRCARGASPCSRPAALALLGLSCAAIGLRSSCSSTRDQRRRYERLSSFWRLWAQANLISSHGAALLFARPRSKHVGARCVWVCAR